MKVSLLLWLCAWFGHNWTKWEDSKTFRLGQMRACKRCGYKELHYL